MERAGFILTILAGLATCVLLAWQGYQGPRVEWINGLLCVVWSLLMLWRLMVLTAPYETPGDGHLAQKLISSLHKNVQQKRSDILRAAFGQSFFVFLTLGLVFAAWQLVCAALSRDHALLQGAGDAIQGFFALESGAAPSLVLPLAFDWGQGFLWLLCLSMMGFMLRSFAYDLRAVRVALLVIGGYTVAGAIVFAGMSVGVMAAAAAQGAMPPSIIGYGMAAGWIAQSHSLAEAMLLETGILGVALIALILCVPLGFIWLCARAGDPDFVVMACGTLAVAGLVACAFFAFHPALGGFAFLCWMGVFLAWGASDLQLAGQIETA